MVERIVLKPMSLFEKIAWSFFIASMVFLISEAFSIGISPSGVPVKIHKTEAINSPVHVGELLEVRIVRDKSRDDCSLRSERDAQNEDGKNFHLGVVLSEGGPAGTRDVIVSYPTNALPPGSYDLKVTLAYICPEKVYFVNQPDTRFRVLP